MTDTSAPATDTATAEATGKLDPALEVGAVTTDRAAVVRREASTTPAPAPGRPPQLGLLKPLAPIAEILQQQNDLRQYIKAGLVEDRDYGTIPGIAKPTLLKPGAERVNGAYGVIPRFTIVEKEIDHDRPNPWRKERRRYEGGTWTGDVDVIEGESLGLYRVVMLCELVHRESGVVIGSCIGSCSTLESKYIDRPRDSENTIYKMAEKRSYVGATLTAYGLSDEFTQDVEDTGASDAGEVAAGAGAAAAGPPKTPVPVCPVHNVPMRDFRARKKNVKAPDWKCTQHEMRDNGQGGKVKVWCEEVKWPGEWPPKAPVDPRPPAVDQTGPTSAPTSVGSAGLQSASNTTPNRNGSANTSPDAPIQSAAGAPESSDSSPASGTNASGSSSVTTGQTSTIEVTRQSVIEWATAPRLAPIQGKTLANLRWEQLDYFRRNAAALPAGWLAAIEREMTMREDTGGVDEPQGAVDQTDGYQ